MKFKIFNKIIITIFLSIIAQNNCIDNCLKNFNKYEYCERKCRASLMDADDNYYREKSESQKKSKKQPKSKFNH